MQNAETKPARSVKTFFHSSFIIHRSAFVLLALLALVLRLPQLGSRPMHTDEAINAYMAGQLLAGERYHYDPQDRHGPALMELTLPVLRLEGARNYAELTESQLRLVTVLVGSATVLLFGAAVEMLGFIPCLVAALLFAFAPLPAYYSRYFIHETVFVAATLGLIVAGGRAWQKCFPPAAALAGFCTAGMLACKETAGLHFVALGLAVALGWRLRALGKIPPVRIWLTALISFLLTGILLFTWGGQNWSALADLIRAVPHLAARASGEGHEKPCWYYLGLLAGGWSGAIILALALLGIFRATGSFLRLSLAAYAILIYGVYCVIPYKTPWLALNFWLPISLLAGFAVERLWLATTKPSLRAVILSGGIVIGCLVAHDTRERVFLNPIAEKNPYAYSHTTDDLLGLPVRLDELSRQNNLSSPRIAVIAKDAWPLPWYLRQFPAVGYWQPGQDPGAADFYITTTDVPDALAEKLKPFRPEFFGVRLNVLLILWTPPKAEAGHE